MEALIFSSNGHTINATGSISEGVAIELEKLRVVVEILNEVRAFTSEVENRTRIYSSRKNFSAGKLIALTEFSPSDSEKGSMEITIGGFSCLETWSDDKEHYVKRSLCTFKIKYDAEQIFLCTDDSEKPITDPRGFFFDLLRDKITPGRWADIFPRIKSKLDALESKQIPASGMPTL